MSEPKKKLTEEELKAIRSNNYKIMIKKKYKDRYLFDENIIEGNNINGSTNEDKTRPNENKS